MERDKISDSCLKWHVAWQENKEENTLGKVWVPIFNFIFIWFISLLYFRMEMEEVVASVFDLMGKTSEPQLEEEFLKARVDNMFHVRL